MVGGMQHTRSCTGRSHTTAVAVHRRIEGPVAAPPCIDVVVPVYNEAVALEASIAWLYDYLDTSFPFTWRITIVDNAVHRRHVVSGCTTRV